MLLAIINATVPADFLDQMFAADHTVSPNTITSIFNRNHADEHFHFADYTTAATNRELPTGTAGLFTGLSGSNFSGANGFTIDTPILCQMERVAAERDLNKKSYQWMLYFPA
jgi:hypothetical protein